MWSYLDFAFVPRLRSVLAVLLRLRSGRLRSFIIFESAMTPDYPHKLFSDKRNNYSLLMLTLAMDSAD